MPAAYGTASAVTSRDELLHKLPLLRRKGAQNKFLARHPELLNSETVVWLADSSRDQAKIDTANAISLAEIATSIAGRLKDKAAQARAFRAMGNTLYVSGKNGAASIYHEKSRRIYERLGDRVETARTLSASIQPLILTGQYDRALANVKRARQIFARLKDRWRLARLDLNTGNIFHRQDQFPDALKWYRRAHRCFAADPERDPEAMGVALHNIAMCLVSLNDFQGAFAAHSQARSFAEKHGMTVLVAQADYNIAALHYLRGEHSRAIRMLHVTLEACKKTNDPYHVALCRLDLSEIYLQLNLPGPAEEMAHEASADFKKLEMGYETGKSLVNLALAMSRQNRHSRGIKILSEARRRFVKEKNFAWPSLTDFYHAIILTSQQRYQEAWNRCLAANRFFRTAGIPDKLILTYLLLGRLRLQMGQLRGAEQACSRALGALKPVELPLLACQAQQLMGRIQMAAGRTGQAYEAYQEARRLLEAMRSDIGQEELKISFMEDKLEVYEGLVQLCLEPGSVHINPEEAFHYIEQSKSRSLQDLISYAESQGPSPDEDSDDQRKARDLRAEINWYSRRLSEEQLRGSASSPQARTDLQAAIHKRERNLLRLFREMPLREAQSVGLVASEPATLEEIRESLPVGACLIEYFQAQSQVLAAVLSKKSLHIIPVAQVGEIRQLLEHLEFQFAKFRLGPDYVRTFGDSLLTTTQHHLRALYRKLIFPVEDQLDAQHLVIVPHGPLHRLPFQTLFDGKQYLIDRFAVSYAPSATIERLCGKRPINKRGPAIVMGVPDAAAPLIGDEALAVAKILPDSRLSMGEQATVALLQQEGPQCRLIHIATHGYYRQDSPMFSGIRLADSILSLYDLYRLRFPVELITLSGCSTGVSTVAGGDELLGLVRGLIYAGARAALLTLWDVQDRSTLELMTAFYRLFASGENKAVALQKAVLEVRERYAHPYYWGPFSLVGNIS